jgi:DNA-binding response OmpR family regulator
MRSAYDVAAAVGQQLVDEIDTLTESLGEWLNLYRPSRRVLVVEDDGDLCTFLQAALASALKVPVDATQSGEDAYRKWCSARHGVVVMDVQLMERYSGVHVAQSLGRGPRIILITGMPDKELLGGTARALHADIVRKPFSIKELTALVRLRLDEVSPA